jgi:hypothetical protein
MAHFSTGMAWACAQEAADTARLIRLFLFWCTKILEKTNVVRSFALCVCKREKNAQVQCVLMNIALWFCYGFSVDHQPG